MTLSNDYLFTSVYQNNDILIQTIELVLNRKVKSIQKKEIEKVLKIGRPFKYIRLDVYFEDSTDLYNIELQTSSDPVTLAKRLRYYQGLIDSTALYASDDYKSLRDSYIIFFCLEDVFNDEKLKHIFTDKCILTGDELGTGAYKILYNLEQYEQEPNKILRSYFKYLMTNNYDNNGGVFMETVIKEIDKTKHGNAKVKKMYLFEYLKELEREQEKQAYEKEKQAHEKEKQAYEAKIKEYEAKIKEYEKQLNM